jgi:hypothetical protein
MKSRLTRGSILMVGLILVSIARAEPPVNVQREVNFLLSYIGRSGCEFYRNGTWSDSKTAQTHLRDKYNYLGACRTIKIGGLTFSGAALLGKSNPHSKRLPRGFLARNKLALSSFSAHRWDFAWFSGLTRRQHMHPFQIIGHGYQLPFARGRL